MTKTPFLLLLALSACAAAPQPIVGIAIRDVDAEPGDCALTVRFGSYAMGIDRTAASRIEALVTDAQAVTATTRHRWGREGEYTLCIRTASAEGAANLFAQIQPLVPPRPRGPIHLSTAYGRTFEAPAR